MTRAEGRYVFVYGTLRSGEQRDINLLKPSPQWVGEGLVAGTLYDLGDYPGIRLNGPGSVCGEVYRISAELERVLDDIEEVWPQQTGEYARREASIELVTGGQASGEGDPAIDCLVYEIATQRTLGRAVIADGDWVRHRKCKAS